MQVCLIIVVELLLDSFRVFGDRKLSELLFVVAYVLQEIVHNAFLTQRTTIATVFLVHGSDSLCIINELNEASLIASFHHVVADHAKVVSRRLPKTVHNLEELEH